MFKEDLRAAFEQAHLDASRSPLGRGRRSTQKALSTQILIHFRPVETVAGAAKLPVLTLFRGGFQKPWVLRQRNDNCASVDEIDR